MVHLVGPRHLPAMAAFFAVMFKLARAHVLPRATPRPMATLPHHELDVVPWPLSFPTPTPFLRSPNRELRRQESPDEGFNTICGYIGGNPDLPATCSAGSHCVLAAGQGAIGCCPDGGPCTTGVFTGCVDVNSSPQTVIDPYVYTCSGANVCYQNIFDGGYSQFGCGTASDMATSVRSAAGSATVVLTSVTVQFTATVETLESPTTIGSRTESESTTTDTTSSRTTTKTTTSSSSSSSTSSSISSTSSSTVAPDDKAPTAAPSVEGSENSPDGMIAIITGALAGFSLLVALLAVGLFFWRRHKAKQQEGEASSRGDDPKPKPPAGPPRFTPPHTHDANFEAPPKPPMASIVPGGDAAPRRNPFNESPPQPVGGSRFYEHQETPLQRPQSAPEMEDFQKARNQNADTVSKTASDGVSDQTRVDGDASTVSGVAGTGHRGSHGSDRPLWQQNRRHSRSLMWI